MTVNKEKIIIRPEKLSEYEKVDQLMYKAFVEQHSIEIGKFMMEHFREERKKDTFVPELSLVAVLENGTIVGEVALHETDIVTENGNLIGPLSSKECMVIENQAIYDIGKIAKNSSLSAITIKKIIAIIKINNSNMITTQDLSLHLKSTVRNANRILKNLEKSGYAKITCTQTTNTKGRPTKVYELNFHI